VHCHFVGNTARIPAVWKSDCEDRWTFVSEENQREDNVLSIRIDDFERQKEDLSLCFELVVHYAPPGSKRFTTGHDIEMSCSYGVILVSNLLKGSSTKTILLSGGEPAKTLEIRKEDVRTHREGWRNLIKVLSKSITPTLTIEVASQVSKENTKLVEVLPMIIVKKNALPFVSLYREYFAWKSIYK
jgi:hypothetical protein